MTQSSIPLSVLDLSPVPAGGTAADALRNTIDLAQAAERSGYHRYWVAEHHLAEGVASSVPGVLVALIAGATDRIRVGSGAVLLPNLAPLVAAEQFGTIAALHPGRVDLGLGRFDLHRVLSRRSGGGPPQVPERVVDGVLLPKPQPKMVADTTAYAALGELLGYRLDEPPADYAAQIADVLAFLRGSYTAPNGRPLHVSAAEGADVEVWILGSTPGDSARTAGQAGLPLAASYHVAPTFVLETVAAYREAFRPSEWLDEPYVMVSADVVVADDDETARELAAPYAKWVLDIRSGKGATPYLTPAEANALEWTDEERAAVADRVATQFVGSPATVAERLHALTKVTGANELVVTTITSEHADRVRSHELLAKHWLGQE